MKRVIIIAFLFSCVLCAQKKEELQIYFIGDSVFAKTSGEVTFPQFTPGNHHHDNTLRFKENNIFYSALLPEFVRGASSGKLNDVILYHISSGPVPKNLTSPLFVRVNIPAEYNLIWCGRVWSGVASVTQMFRNYFIAREFPLILVRKGDYIEQKSKNVNCIYVFCDSTRSAFQEVVHAVDSAVTKFVSLFPRSIKVLANYGDKRGFTLVCLINKKVNTGLEHFNAPYTVVTPNFVSNDGIFHTLFHSVVGKALMPREYLRKDGKFYPTDALGLYEGLTTFCSLRFVKNNFNAHISANVYRAKLDAACNDITTISVCGAKNEKWYASGYLFWVYLVASGLDIDLFLRYIDQCAASGAMPRAVSWGDVLHWLDLFDKKIGRLAKEGYRDVYLEKAFSFLKQNGWQLIPVWEVPRWYDFHIGPYPIRENDYQLPTDEYLMTSARPKFLIMNDGTKMQIEAKKDNPALSFIKSHPDSMFIIEFSDATVRTVKNKLYFADGAPYFMHGTITINSENKEFWKRLNNYIIPAR